MISFKQYREARRIPSWESPEGAQWQPGTEDTYSVYDRDIQYTWLQIKKFLQDASVAISKGEDHRTVFVHLEEKIYEEFDHLQGQIGQPD